MLPEWYVTCQFIRAIATLRLARVTQSQTFLNDVLLFELLQYGTNTFNFSHIAVTSKLGQNLHKMPWTMPVQLEVVEIRAAGQFNFKVDM